MCYKRPESVLVVIYSQHSQRVLMLQRCDDLDFWQSVTGSLEDGESPREAALREVKEEINIDIVAEGLELIDFQRSVKFEIFPQRRRRYAPGITHNLEHWYGLILADEQMIQMTEHSCYLWVEKAVAMMLTKSWNNRQAIAEFVV